MNASIIFNLFFFINQIKFACVYVSHIVQV